MRRTKADIAAPVLLALLVLSPASALATQGHGGMEGLYAHQAAHLFFAAAMGVLWYWLRKTGLTAVRGWRFIQYSAVLFLLWNLDAFAVHELDEHLSLVLFNRADNWHLAFDASGGRLLPAVYYILKMDHLLCVPALAFLYVGLKSLLYEPAPQQSPGEGAP